MLFRLLRGILLLGTVSIVAAMVVGLSGNSSSQSIATSRKNPPDGFRGVKWNSPLPSIQKLREAVLLGCSAVVQQKNFTDAPPCSHMHIDTDDMELFAQRRKVAPIFGVAVSEQLLTWSHRKFWSGEVFIYNYNSGDLAKLRAALTDQYGNSDVMQDRITEWRWPAKKVLVQLSYDPTPKPSVGPAKIRRTSISLLFSKID